MNIKNKYLIRILSLVVIICLSIVPQVRAEKDNWGGMISEADEWLSYGKDQSSDTQTNVDAVQDSISFIYNTLLAIGLVGSVIIGGILGIQYMTSGVEEKAKIKETLTTYIVGCIVMFTAFGIWKLVVTILKQV